MKKTLIALAVLGSIAGFAQAQSNVTIYGVLDAGFTKKSGDTADTATKIGRGDNNRIGFKGVEDLGGGLSATFQIENRFEPDTGTVENGTRPLFQGRTTVGLAGAFGSVKLGRELSSVQAVNPAFDPFGTTTVGAFAPFFMGNYNSDALSTANAQNRFSNGVFYNSPVMSGFALGVSAATKEGPAVGAPAGTELPKNAYSLAGTYKNGPIGAMLGYERNGISDKFWQLAGSYKVGPANLMASYSRAKVDLTDFETKSWMLGADIVAGPGNVKIGYGQQKPDSDLKSKKFAIGYQYSLSKRTYLYVDAANLRTDVPVGGDINVRLYDLGLHHSF